MYACFTSQAPAAQLGFECFMCYLCVCMFICCVFLFCGFGRVIITINNYANNNTTTNIYIYIYYYYY